MIPNKKFYAHRLFVTIVAVALATFSFVYAAWQEPTDIPPGDNAAAPINVSNVGQRKYGSLQVQGLNVDSSSFLSISSGNVGIGYDPSFESIPNKLSVKNGNAYFSGNIGIGTAPTNYRLDVNGVLRLWPVSAPATPANGVIYYDSAKKSFRCYQDNTWIDNCFGGGGGGGIDGTGTTNYVPKFVDNNTLGNSQIFDNGTSIGMATSSTAKVGIGTIDPQSKLHVANGYIQARGLTDALSFPTVPTSVNNAEFVTYNTTQSNNWGGFGIYGNGAMWFRGENITFWANGQDGTPDNEVMSLGWDGAVGIGTTIPERQLDIIWPGQGPSGIRIQKNSDYLSYSDADIKLKYGDRGAGGRAIVHWLNNTLSLNHDGDFTGGTKIGVNTLFTANNSSSYINAAGGMVGIGTNNPGATLHINNASNISENMKVANVGGIYVESSTGVSPAIVLSSDGIFSGGAAYFGQTQQANHGVIGSSLYDGVIGVSVGANNSQIYRRLILATGAGGVNGETQKARMTISSLSALGDNGITGIGINTVDPRATLDIRDVRPASDNEKVENVGGVYIEASTGSGISPAIVLSRGGTQTNGSVYIGHVASDNHGGVGTKFGDAVIGTRGGSASGTGNFNIATGKPGSGQSVKMVVDFSGDVLIKEASKGLILTSPSGRCYKVTVSDAGNIVLSGGALPRYYGLGCSSL